MDFTNMSTDEVQSVATYRGGTLDLRQQASAELRRRIPGPENEDWFDFLHFLAEGGMAAKDLIYVLEKPYKYEDEYGEYHEAGGLER